MARATSSTARPRLSEGKKIAGAVGTSSSEPITAGSEVLVTRGTRKGQTVKVKRVYETLRRDAAGNRVQMIEFHGPGPESRRRIDLSAVTAARPSAPVTKKAPTPKAKPRSDVPSATPLGAERRSRVSVSQPEVRAFARSRRPAPAKATAGSTSHSSGGVNLRSGGGRDFWKRDIRGRFSR